MRPGIGVPGRLRACVTSSHRRRPRASMELRRDVSYCVRNLGLPGKYQFGPIWRMERVVLDSPVKLNPPAPTPRLKPLGPLALLRVLTSNPLEAWTMAHFEKPIVMGGLSIGRVAVVSDPAAIRHVLLE